MNTAIAQHDDDILEITKGSREFAFRGEPGVYPATLVTHSIEGPFQSKQKPGEEFKLHEWGFAIDDAPDDGTMVWYTTSMATGPKSRTYGVVTALFDGREPPAGTQLRYSEHLIGRRALVDVRENDRGYLGVVGVTPLPKGAARAAAQPATPAPAGAPVPAAQPVAQANPDNLPF